MLNGTFGPIQQSIGTVVLMVQFSLQAQFPLFASSFIVDQIQRAPADSKDFFEVMSLAPTIRDVEDAVELKVSAGKVEYANVSFHYRGGQAVLHYVSFTIAPGTSLALIGESGEGKTTLANLLLRFYEPAVGTIRVDGVDIEAVHRHRPGTHEAPTHPPPGRSHQLPRQQGGARGASGARSVDAR